MHIYTLHRSQRGGCCCQPNFGSIGGEPCTQFPMVGEYHGNKRPRSWPYMSALQATTWCPFNPSKAFDSSMAPVVKPPAASETAVPLVKTSGAEAGSETAGSETAGGEAVAGSEAAGGEAAAFIELLTFKKESSKRHVRRRSKDMRMKATRAEPGSEASGSESSGSESSGSESSGSESAGSESAGSESAGSEIAGSGSEVAGSEIATATENAPTCRFFPGLDPGPNGNCLESCSLLRSAFELKQEQMKRLAAVRSVDQMYDLMLAQAKAPPKKPTVNKPKSGAETAKAGGEAAKKL